MTSPEEDLAPCEYNPSTDARCADANARAPDMRQHEQQYACHCSLQLQATARSHRPRFRIGTS